MAEVSDEWSSNSMGGRESQNKMTKMFPTVLSDLHYLTEEPTPMTKSRRALLRKPWVSLVINPTNRPRRSSRMLNYALHSPFKKAGAWLISCRKFSLVSCHVWDAIAKDSIWCRVPTTPSHMSSAMIEGLWKGLARICVKEPTAASTLDWQHQLPWLLITLVLDHASSGCFSSMTERGDESGVVPHFSQHRITPITSCFRS